jgi:hypothetical protein
MTLANCVNILCQKIKKAEKILELKSINYGSYTSQKNIGVSLSKLSGRLARLEKILGIIGKNNSTQNNLTNPCILVSQLNNRADKVLKKLKSDSDSEFEYFIVGDILNNRAYVYTYSNNKLIRTDILTSSFSPVNFGFSVSISDDGTTAIVGDPDGGDGSGNAIVFRYDGSSWDSGTELTSSFIPKDFGFSVSISDDGTTAIVGDPDGGDGSGNAIVFRYDGSSWDSGTELTSSFSPSSFGSSVSISGDGTTAIVGDPLGGDGSGNAVVFRYDGISWDSGTELTSSFSPASFGNSVSISGDGTTAIVGDPSGGDGSGNAIVFRYNGSSWDSGIELTSPVSSINFGSSASISGDGTTAIVGDPLGGDGSGNAIVFRYNGSSWDSGIELTSSFSPAFFGFSVSILGDGNTTIVGDPGSNNVVIFKYNENSWTTFTLLSGPLEPGVFGISVGSSGGSAAGSGSRLSKEINILEIVEQKKMERRQKFKKLADLFSGKKIDLFSGKKL